MAIAGWRLPAGTAFDFFASGTLPGALGGVNLVEGGDGYRQQVLRSDFDCLMRRMPVTTAVAVTGAAGQPIRDGNVPFCRVCRQWLEAVLRGTQQVHAGERIRLDSQRIGYDWVSWKTRESPPAGFTATGNFHRVHTVTVPADEPRWSMTISYNPAAAALADLFQISDVQLAQRPGDPYSRAAGILRSLRFTGLAVSYTHRTRPGAALAAVQTTLAVADAVRNALDPPRLELASGGGRPRPPARRPPHARLAILRPVAGSSRRRSAYREAVHRRSRARPGADRRAGRRSGLRCPRLRHPAAVRAARPPRLGTGHHRPRQPGRPGRGPGRRHGHRAQRDAGAGSGERDRPGRLPRPGAGAARDRPPGRHADRRQQHRDGRQPGWPRLPATSCCPPAGASWPAST